MRPSTHPRRGGFTLVELLVVIGIIGLLISILLPALRKAREHANAVVCQSNQRQLIMAFLMFANDHQQHLPGNYFDAASQQRDPEKRDWLLGDNPNQGNSALQYLDGPQKEADHVQELDREDARGDRERYRRCQRQAHEVADDEQAALVDAVDEDAGDPAKEDVWDELHDAQGRDGRDRVREVEDEER